MKQLGLNPLDRNSSLKDSPNVALDTVMYVLQPLSRPRYRIGARLRLKRRITGSVLPSSSQFVLFGLAVRLPEPLIERIFDSHPAKAN